MTNQCILLLAYLLLSALSGVVIAIFHRDDRQLSTDTLIVAHMPMH